MSESLFSLHILEHALYFFWRISLLTKFLFRILNCWDVMGIMKWRLGDDEKEILVIGYYTIFSRARALNFLSSVVRDQVSLIKLLPLMRIGAQVGTKLSWY